MTGAFIPPTALKQMRSIGIDKTAARGIQLRALGTGGEALGEALQAWVASTLGVDVNEFYGQTEMNLTIGTSRSKWSPASGSMGRAFPGFEVTLLDPLGEPVEIGEVGEICVKAGNPGQFLDIGTSRRRPMKRCTTVGFTPVIWVGLMTPGTSGTRDVPTTSFRPRGTESAPERSKSACSRTTR